MPVAVLEKHGFIAGLHAIVYMSFYAYTVISMGTALIHFVSSLHSLVSPLSRFILEK